MKLVSPPGMVETPGLPGEVKFRHARVSGHPGRVEGELKPGFPLFAGMTI
jgi:hypothetical protein